MTAVQRLSWCKARTALLTLPALLMLASPGARAARPPSDPDWPCQQIKMPELSLGAMWDGPDVTPYFAKWSQDAAVAALVESIVQRRMPLDQAQQTVHSFAGQLGPSQRSRLLALMAGVFSTLDAERAQVLAGLDRFGRRQKELAAAIHADMDKLHAQQSSSDAAAPAEVKRLGEQLGWETRVFEQRRQTIRYACAVPDAIEQRLFALARTIAGILNESPP